MGKIGQSLKRKVGPLPMWAWLGIAGVALYLYRRRQAASAAANPDTGSSTTPDTADYGPYGDGAYGDSSGAGSGGSDGSGGGDSGTGTTGSGTTQPAAPVINITPPPTTVSPAAKSKLAKLVGKGAIRATSGPTKPAAKKGYTIKGLGSGAWEYLPVKKTRAKKTKAKSTAKPATAASKKTATRAKATTQPAKPRTKTTTKAAPKTRTRATRK